MRLKVRAQFFYADNGMVEWLQTAFDTLAGIFDQVGLKKMLIKPWGWYATHDGRPWYGQTHPTPGG